MHREHAVAVVPDAIPASQLKWPNGKRIELAGKMYVFPPLTARATLKVQEISQSAALEVMPMIPKLKELQIRASEDVTKLSEEDLAKLTLDLNQASALLPKVANLELSMAIKVAHICLTMNYADITEEDFSDMVTPDQAKELMAWAMFGDSAAKKS